MIQAEQAELKESSHDVMKYYPVEYVCEKLKINEKDILYLASEHKIRLLFHTDLPEGLIITIKDSELWNHADLSSEQNLQIFVSNVHNVFGAGTGTKFTLNELRDIYDVIQDRGSFSYLYKYHDKNEPMYFVVSDWCLYQLQRNSSGNVTKLTFGMPSGFIQIAYYWCHCTDAELLAKNGWSKILYTENLYKKSLNIPIGQLVMTGHDFDRIKNFNAMPMEFRALYQAHQHLTAEELRQLKLNYVDKTPKLCTYTEAITIAEQHGDVNDAIRIAIESNTLVPYIKITTSHKIEINQQLPYAWVEPNHEYKIRYKNLERLQKHMLDEIFQNGSYSGFYQSEWQTLKDLKAPQLMEQTVFESWLGITSEVKFDKIELSDLVFLKDDVDAYFSNVNTSVEQQKKSSSIVELTQSIKDVKLRNTNTSEKRCEIARLIKEYIARDFHIIERERLVGKAAQFFKICSLIEPSLFQKGTSKVPYATARKDISDNDVAKWMQGVAEAPIWNDVYQKIHAEMGKN